MYIVSHFYFQIMHVYVLGMGDIDILSHDYCHEQTSRLSRLLSKNTKCAMDYHVSDKINGNSVEILKYFYNYHDYCRLQLLLIYENYTIPIIANKIITIFSIIE